MWRGEASGIPAWGGCECATVLASAPTGYHKGIVIQWLSYTGSSCPRHPRKWGIYTPWGWISRHTQWEMQMQEQTAGFHSDRQGKTRLWWRESVQSLPQASCALWNNWHRNALGWRNVLCFDRNVQVHLSKSQSQHLSSRCVLYLNLKNMNRVWEMFSVWSTCVKCEGQSSGPQTSCQSWEGAETTYNHIIWEA